MIAGLCIIDCWHSWTNATQTPAIIGQHTLCTQLGMSASCWSVRPASEPGVREGRGKKVGQSPSFRVVQPFLYLPAECPTSQTSSPQVD